MEGDEGVGHGRPPSRSLPNIHNVKPLSRRHSSAADRDERNNGKASSKSKAKNKNLLFGRFDKTLVSLKVILFFWYGGECTFCRIFFCGFRFRFSCSTSRRLPAAVYDTSHGSDRLDGRRDRRRLCAHACHASFGSAARRNHRRQAWVRSGTFSETCFIHFSRNSDNSNRYYS